MIMVYISKGEISKSFGFNFEPLQTLVCDFRRIVSQITMAIKRFRK